MENSANPVIEGVHVAWLPDGRRLHLRHGPIDLIIEVQGSKEVEQAAIAQVVSVFPKVLPELVRELDLLRKPINLTTAIPDGLVAQSMVKAAQRHASSYFVTPMIAVAGSVADYILQILTTDYQLMRAYVNNGGDIALFLSEGQVYDVAVCDRFNLSDHTSTLRLDAASEIRGIATSGWQGRSHSLGVADAVTVLASDAAGADAAATLIANAVDVPSSSRVSRVAASAIMPDSDLAETPVTVNVEQLSEAEVDLAINNGVSAASTMLQQGLIKGVLIALQGSTKVLGAACHTNLVSA